MKQNEDNPMQNGATFTEMEYTPISHNPKENKGVNASEDEASSFFSTSHSSPVHEAIEETPSADKPIEDPSALTADAIENEIIVMENDSAVEEINLIQEGEQTNENTSEPESVVTYERIVLPDEISLADVTVIDDSIRTEETATPTAIPIPLEEVRDEDDTPLEPIPTPAPVEYERVVLPDEISLMDVLQEIRPMMNIVEESVVIEERIALESSEDTSEPMLSTNEETNDALIAGEEDLYIPLATEKEEMLLNSPVSETDPLPIIEEEQEIETLNEIPETYDSEETPILSCEDIVEDNVGEKETTENPDMVATGESASENIDALEEEIEEAEPVTELSSKEMPKERPIEGRFDMVELFAFTLAFVLLLTTFFFRSSTVIGSSMEGTLHNGDQLILYAFMYEPKVGDIIVFEDYSTGYREPLVKRVIATEGQTVEIQDAYNVYVDGKRLEEDYVFLDGYDTTDYPIIHTVAEGHIFVMGDHRNASADSRIFLDVSVETVLGKVLFRYYPFDTFTKFD